VNLHEGYSAPVTQGGEAIEQPVGEAADALADGIDADRR
jgi:hypothetical protein